MSKKLGFFTIAMALAGAFFSRWHGGGFISGSPKVLKNFLWALPFAAGVIWAWYALPGADYAAEAILNALSAENMRWMLPIIPLIVALLVFAWSVQGKATGHGGGMDLAHSPKEPGAGRNPEKVEYLILWLHGRMPQYWYDFFLMALIGLNSTLGASIAIGALNAPAGILIALGGISKAPAYAIGWKLQDAGLLGWLPKDINHATAIGELLAGFFAYGAFGTALVLLGS